MSFFAASLSSSFHRSFASNSSFSAFARWRFWYVCSCCLYSGLVFPLSSPFITILKFSLVWSILCLSCDANRSRCCLSYLVQLPHSSARFTMSLCVCGHHRYCETPSMVSCPGCPRWILLSTAWQNCTGISSLLSTRMQSSCTAICNHKGLVYRPISWNPCLSPRSINRLSRSIQVSSVVNSAKRLLSKKFEILSNVSSVDCLCSFCSFRLRACLLGGSIVRIYLSSSVSSVVVRSNLITCTSHTFLSTCCAGDVLIGMVCSPPSPLPVLEYCLMMCWIPPPPINCQNDRRFVSASFCWSSDSCHFTRDWCLVSLSELSLFFRLPPIIFLVRCSVSVNSSSDSSFVLFIEQFHRGSLMLSPLS